MASLSCRALNASVLTVSRMPLQIVQKRLRSQAQHHVGAVRHQLFSTGRTKRQEAKPARGLGNASTSGDAETATWKTVLKAADQGTDAGAMYNAGLAQSSGDGGAPVDAHAAKEWLQRAAEMGHAQAQFQLGQIVYRELEDMRAQSNVHDYQAAAEAERWLTRAAAQGERDAARALLTFHASHGNVFGVGRTLSVWLFGS